MPANIASYFDENSLNTLLSDKNELKNSLSLFFLNTRSLPANFSTLDEYLSTIDMQCMVYGFAETWLKPENEKLFILKDYSYTGSIRKERMGGGVALQTHKSISYKELPHLSSSDESIESVFIEITKLPNRNEKPIIGVVYRPPNSNFNHFLEKFESIINQLNQSHKPCYIMGDFNVDLLTQTNPSTKSFTDLIYSNSFLPLIDKPTRIKPPSSTLIDNILTNSTQQTHVSGILYTDISDHLPIFSINQSIPLNSSSLSDERTYQCRSFSEANVTAFHERLRATEWSDVLSHHSCDEAYSRFLSLLSDHYNQSFPIITRKITDKKNQPWITRPLKKIINKKNRLYKVFLHKPTVYNEINYRIAKTNALKQIRQARKDFYHNLLEIHKNNMKKTWSIIKEVIGFDRPTTIINSVLVDGSMISEPTEVANQLNNYFSNIGNKLASSIPRSDRSPLSYLGTAQSQSFFISPVTPDELRNCISQLKEGSAGFDDLKPKVIKQSVEYVLDPLLHIINLSFTTGVVPQLLKRANVTPIFKGGDPTELGNYRPISVLPVFSKILEKLMFKRLYSYLTNNDILYQKQFGFRRGYSTEMALLSAVDTITKSLDGKNHVIAIFLDFRKAFDTVDPEILLSKLDHHGVRGIALEWFRSYLSTRTQKVKVNNVISNLNPVTCGVPQGSTLGPLLFLLCINDLPNVLTNISSIIFADDTSLFYSGQQLHLMIPELNTQLSHLLTWLQTNRLSLNLSKTFSMLFTLSPNIYSTDLPITINNHELERVRTIKFLGVIFYDKLTWSDHINQISNKVAKSIGIINKIKHSLSKNTLTMLYYSLVYPYLTYCGLVWGKASPTTLQKIVVLQKRVIRTIHLCKYLEHTPPLFKSSKILPFCELYVYLCSIFVFKCLKNMFPPDFNSALNPFTFSLQSINSTRSSSDGKYVVPYARTKLRQNFLSIQSIKMYNEFILPLNLINQINTVMRFKKVIRNILL